VAARAQRRFLEMQAQGRDITLAEIETDLAARDERDATRAAAPLIAAGDAVVLDTSLLNRHEAIARAIALVEMHA
jgi:cytidylate kinase